jgi:WD40 repeat protein
MRLTPTRFLVVFSLPLFAATAALWPAAADEPALPPGVVATLKGHTETLYAVAFSPDSKLAVTGSFDKTLKLWDTTTGKELKTLGGPAGHQNLVLSTAFSPDGQMIASGSSDNTAKIWDVPAAGFLQELVHADAVQALALSADGQRLAAGVKDGTIKIWTPVDGKEVLSLTGHAGPVTAVASNAQAWVGAGADGTLRYWNPANGQPMASLVAHSGPINGLALHPSAPLAFTVGEDGLLKFWQVPSPSARQLHAQADRVTALAVSADGNLVASAGADKSVRLTNFADGKPIRELAGASAALQSMSLSPALVAAGTTDGKVVLWNLADGKLVREIPAHAGAVSGVALHPQNSQLLTAGADGLLKVWAMPPGPSRSLAHPEVVLSAAVSGDSGRLFTGSSDRIVRAWNLGNNSVERQFTGHAGPVTAVMVSPNGQLLASGSADQTIRVWDQATGKEKIVIGAHSDAVTSLAAHPGGSQLVSGSTDGTIKLWGLGGGPPRVFIHPEQVTSVAIAPDGQKMLTGCLDKQARLWNISDGKLERTFPALTLAVTSVAFNHDGTYAAAGAADKSLTVWTTADAKEIKKLSGLPGVVQSLTFAPVGPTPSVAAGLSDNTVRVFDVAQGTETKNVQGHTAPVNTVLFSAKGDLLISGGADGAAHVWNVADGMVKAKLDYGAPVASVALTKDGARLAVGGAAKTVKIFSLADGKLAATLNTPAEVRGLAWNADGSRLAVAGADHQARVYLPDGRLGEFFTHEGPLTACAFLPDGKRLVTASADKSARIWSPGMTWQAAHGGPVRQVIFNAKGDVALSAGDDKTIKVWNAVDGTLFRSIAAHDGAVAAIGLTPDGSQIVSAGADGKLRVWPMAPTTPAAADKPSKEIALAGAADGLALSPNGTRIAVSHAAQPAPQVAVYDLATAKEVFRAAQPGKVRALSILGDSRSLVAAGDDKAARIADIGVMHVAEAHPGGATAVAFHGNGAQALTAGADKTVKLWNLPPGQPPTIASTFGPLPEAIATATYNRDFTQVGAVSGKTVKVWNLADGKETLQLNHPSPVKALSFSADKTKIATGAADGRTRVWDITTGKELQAFAQPAAVEAVAFHPNNSVIISGNADKSVSVDTLSVQRAIVAAAGPIRGLAVTPNGSHVLTTDGKDVRLWNTANGAKEERVFGGATDVVNTIAVSKNGALVAVGGADQIVRVYTFADAKLVRDFKAPAPVQRLAFSPNNQTLLAGCADKSLVSWSVAFTPGQPPPADFGKAGPVFQHEAGITDVLFDSDNRFFTSGSDKKVRRWKTASEAPIKEFKHPNLVNCVAFNSDGTQLATACHDGTIRTWDIAKGQQIRQINAHTTPAVSHVYCVAWSPDGKQLVSGSYDRSLKLWDASNGNLIREFKPYKEKEFDKGHRDGVFCAAFTKDGKFLVTGSSDHTVKIWNVADGSVARELTNPNLKPPPAGPAQPPQAHPGWVYDLRITPDGQRLVTAGNAPKLRGYLAVWNLADGNFLYGEELPLGPIYSVAVSAKGDLMGLACGPRMLQLPDASGYLMKMPPLKQ